MKTITFLIIGILGILPFKAKSQDKPVQAVALSDCPAVLLAALNADSLQYKAALIIINESSHPLGKTEFRDNQKAVRYLRVPMKMNRITLLYIEPGLHRFHTMYQKQVVDTIYQPGDIYLGVLTSRSVWPVPYALMKPDAKGEFGPVLLHYITAAEAEELIGHLKKTEVVINP